MEFIVSRDEHEAELKMENQLVFADLLTHGPPKEIAAAAQALGLRVWNSMADKRFQAILEKTQEAMGSLPEHAGAILRVKAVFLMQWVAPIGTIQIPRAGEVISALNPQVFRKTCSGCRNYMGYPMPLRQESNWVHQGSLIQGDAVGPELAANDALLTAQFRQLRADGVYDSDLQSTTELLRSIGVHSGALMILVDINHLFSGRRNAISGIFQCSPLYGGFQRNQTFESIAAEKRKYYWRCEECSGEGYQSDRKN